MDFHGHVQDGVVVFDGGPPLPDGTEVIVYIPTARLENSSSRRRIKAPLVPSKNPGSLRLTADRVAELLEDDDVSA